MDTAEALVAETNGTALPDLKLAAMLRCRVRYFTDGAVIGSRAFVNEAFAAARERFTKKRKDGRGRGQSSHGNIILFFGSVVSGQQSAPRIFVRGLAVL